MENPQYTARTDIRRLLIAQFLKVVGLCVLFYTGIVINLKLLDIEVSSLLNILIVVIVIGLLAAQLVLTYSNSLKRQYLFYTDRIEYAGKKPKTIYFKDVTDISSKRDFLDKVIGTGTIVLEPGFKISSIDKADQTMYYAEKLVENYRSYAQQQPSYQQLQQGAG